MKILGLDLATISGWAVLEDKDVPRAGAFRAKGDDDGAQAADFRRWLRALIALEKPDYCAIEAPKLMLPRAVAAKFADLTGERQTRAIDNPRTTAKLNWLNVIAQMTCHELGLPYELVPDATHRKAFLGAGKIPRGQGKTLALKQCKLLGVELKSLDAADAVSVAWWGAGRCRQGRIKPGDLFNEGTT